MDSPMSSRVESEDAFFRWKRIIIIIIIIVNINEACIEFKVVTPLGILLHRDHSTGLKLKRSKAKPTRMKSAEDTLTQPRTFTSNCSMREGERETKIEKTNRKKRFSRCLNDL